MDCKNNGLELAKTAKLTSKTTLTNELVEAISEQKDVNPLEPGFSLYNHLDTAALEALVESVSDEFKIQFAIDDTLVCICKADHNTANIYVKDRQQ
jgi:hypothetical protein